LASYLFSKQRVKDAIGGEDCAKRTSASMNDSSVQIIEKDGNAHFAVMPIEISREIVAKLRDVEDCAAIDQAILDDRQGVIPSEIVNAILDGLTPLRAGRENVESTLERLARQVGISKGYLSQVENRRKPGTLALYRKLSGVPNVPIDDLIE